MIAYEFNANIKGGSIRIPEYIKMKIPSECKVMILFEENVQAKEDKLSFAIPHDEFWAELGITPDTDLSNVEEYEISETETVEMLDMYDKDGNKTGIIRKRSEPMSDGEYYRGVNVWIKNSGNKFLISKRSPEKQWGANMWECTDGAVIADEDSFQCALREVKEELGLTLNPDKGRLIGSSTYGNLHKDFYLFCENFDINDVIFQEGETCDVRWASKDEIIKMIESGEFVDWCAEYIDMM